MQPLKRAISEYLSTFKICIPFHTSIPCLGTSTVAFKLLKNIGIFTAVLSVIAYFAISKKK